MKVTLSSSSSWRLVAGKSFAAEMTEMRKCRSKRGEGRRLPPVLVQCLYRTSYRYGTSTRYQPAVSYECHRDGPPKQRHTPTTRIIYAHREMNEDFLPEDCNFACFPLVMMSCIDGFQFSRANLSVHYCHYYLPPTTPASYLISFKSLSSLSVP